MTTHLMTNHQTLLVMTLFKNMKYQVTMDQYYSLTPHQQQLWADFCAKQSLTDNLPTIASMIEFLGNLWKDVAADIHNDRLCDVLFSEVEKRLDKEAIIIDEPTQAITEQPVINPVSTYVP